MGQASAETIVNNESSEIIRMLNSAFDGCGAAPGDYYPEALRRRDRPDQRARLRHRQQRRLPRRLRHHPGGLRRGGRPSCSRRSTGSKRCLASGATWPASAITEADWRLFTTLLRFDPVYHGHFKCNLRRLIDYPNLWAYTRELYQLPGVAETVDFTHIKRPLLRQPWHHQPDRHRPHGTAARLRPAPHGREVLAAAA